MADIELEARTTPVSTLERASFGGIVFAYEKRTLAGGTRFHAHEYPKIAGAKIEKLGRKAYVVRFRAWFHDVPGSLLDLLYPDAYPKAMTDLRTLFEAEETKDLVVPAVGKLRAYCTNWTQELDVRLQSGEAVDLEFLEDLEDELLGFTTRFDAASGDLTQKLANFNEQAALGEYLALDEQPEPSIFDQINEAVGSVIAFRDQVEANATMVEAKVRAVEDLCREADKTVLALQSPENSNVLEALKDLWDAHAQLGKDVLGKNQPILTYIVPRTSSITTIASQIYGDASRSSDLLALNDVDDVTAVPPGAAIRYYQAA